MTESKMGRMTAKEDHDHKWDSWLLDGPSYRLVLGSQRRYQVDLERCTTSAETLDWIMQVTDEVGATPAVLSGLVHALHDVLEPQSTLCGLGNSMELSKAAVRSRVAAFAGRHPELLAAD